MTLPKKPSEQMKLISPEITRLAADYHRDDRGRAFLHWSISQVLSEEGLPDEVIADKLITDGTDDLGVDAFWLDEESKVIHLFQSKYRSDPGTVVPRADVDTFVASVGRLLDPNIVTRARNEGPREINSALVTSIASDFTVHLLFVTTGNIAAKDRNYFQTQSVFTRDLPIHGKNINTRIELDVLDLASLVALFSEQSATPVPAPEAGFILEADKYHAVESGNFRVIDFTIPAHQLVDIYDQYKHDIFRLNPRGPLVRSKINREISKSLENPSTAHLFNILNNGISAICASWQLSRDWKLSIRDFQVVNGCQTTVALHRARAIVRDDPQILVDVKLIEGQEAMHSTIARATNTQNRLRYEDFVSTDPVQDALKTQFERINPPWFYEIKRGEWATWTERKDRFRHNSGYRVLTVKEAAQSALAFAGRPGEAKDKPRQIFEKKISSPDGLYDEVFSEGVEASQLLLPTIVYRTVVDAVKMTEDPPEWLSYARLHGVWLIGELIRQHYGMESTLPPSSERSLQLAESIDNWFPRLFPVVRDAIGDSVQEAGRIGSFRGPREFFRSNDHYGLFRERLDVALARWSDVSRQMSQNEPLSILP